MKALTPGRFAAEMAPFAALALVAVCVCPLLGGVPIDLSRALDAAIPRDRNPDWSLLFQLRVPRVLLAALTGAALGMAGSAFQALLRNPLAEPYTLGVSSGAALGAVLAIKLGLDVAVGGFSAVPVFAFAGSLGAMAVIYGMARGREGFPTSVLLLAGVTLSFVFAAMILFIHYLADFTESAQMVRWMMGGLDIVGMGAVGSLVPPWLVGAAALVLLTRDLNHLAFGARAAESKGINVPRVQKSVFIAASLLTGAVVSAAGPIGFVGLIVPHVVRFRTGHDQRRLLPASAFAGAAFLVVCDTLARSLQATAEIPVGVLTAMLGGPFFLVLLVRQKGKLIG